MAGITVKNNLGSTDSNLMDKKNIETILPLTAMQQGFLWHSLSSPDSAGVGLIQTQCRLDGPLDHVLFERAWLQTVEQHQMLRATVHWENVKKPVMVIHQRVSATIEHLDWRGQAATSKALQEFLCADTETGLVLNEPPVSRITLIRIGDHSHKLVWTSHHLLLDGWSGGLVLDELLARYDSLVEQGSFEAGPAPLFANYLQWIQAQDRSAAQRYWSDLLSGSQPNHRLPNAGPPVIAELSLDQALTERLSLAQRDLATTLNALAQTAWSILLSQLIDRTDVVFGATVSGRQNDYRGVERLVGMLVNVLPVRLKIDPKQSIVELLRTVQSQSFASMSYGFVDTGQIQAWSGCSGGLFNTLLTIENQPIGQSPTALQVSDRHSGIVSAYGVTIIVKPGSELGLSIHTVEALFGFDQASAILDCFRLTLSKLIAAPEQAIGELDLPVVSPLKAWRPTTFSVPPPVQPNSIAMPVSLLEERVGKIWREVLGVESPDRHDSFFDLGGTSMLAIVLFNRLEAEVGVRLPSTTLLQHNSIDSLVDLLAQDGVAAQWADIVAIQPNGEKPPLFIPDISTDLLVYRHLSAELGDSQPVYGFNARGLTQLPLSELAIRLNSQLRAVQPEGPYHLAGLSGGGSLAWMMAQQLRDQEQVVANLILFDSLGPDFPRLQSPAGRIVSSLQGATRVLYGKLVDPEQDKLVNFNAPESLAYQTNSEVSPVFQPTRIRRLVALVGAVTRGRPVFEKIANLVVMFTLKIPTQSNSLAWATFLQGLWLEYIAETESSGESIESPMIEPPIKAAGGVHRRLYGELEPYDGRIQFFWASERPPATLPDEYSGWRKLVTGEFVIHKVPGNHLSLIEPPNVRGLARVLASVLRESQVARKPQV